MNSQSSKPIYKLGEINFKSRRKEKYKRNKSPQLQHEIEQHDDSTRPCLVEEISKKRHNLYASVLEFSFNVNRVRILSECKEMRTNSKGIVYWMSREQRVQDNWSLLYAQKLALENHLPLYVCFCLVPTFLKAPIRHYYFMIEGLKEVKKELESLNIQFYLLLGEAKQQIPIFVRQCEIGCIICDFSPLRVSLEWTDQLAKSLPQHVLIAQVDAHNLFPVWFVSQQKEDSPHTLRPKLNAHLDEFLTEFPPIVYQNKESKKIVSNNSESELKCIDNLDEIYPILEVDRSVKEVKHFKPGYTAAIQMLEDFVYSKTRLKLFDKQRNNPNINGQSNLSPWLHFGQLSAQRCVLEASNYLQDYGEAVQWFYEECVVMRELADNFCYYESNYDNIMGAPEWARQSLHEHANDRREHLYTIDELDKAQTCDALWNAAQIQLREEGKMHHYMRMYWAKKILEWTESPEQALEYTIFLNDRYNLDGRDPNGYMMMMWAIGGVHDKPFAERNVYGKLRSMSRESYSGKFDVDSFINKYKK